MYNILLMAEILQHLKSVRLYSLYKTFIYNSTNKSQDKTAHISTNFEVVCKGIQPATVTHPISSYWDPPVPHEGNREAVCEEDAKPSGYLTTIFPIPRLSWLEFMHQSIWNGCREKSEVQAFTKACIQFTTSARDHRASISKGLMLSWCSTRSVNPKRPLAKRSWLAQLVQAYVPEVLQQPAYEKDASQESTASTQKVDKKPSSQLRTLKVGKASCSFHLMTVDGVPGPESHLFAGLHHCLLQCRAEPHFLHPDGKSAANLYKLHQEPQGHVGHAAKRLLFGIVDCHWCQISCIEYRSRGTGYSSKDILGSMLVPLPPCFPLYTMGSKGLYNIYIGYIYIYHSKKKSQDMEPLSLCEGHHGWLLLYAVLLHDEVHQPMSRSVCKDLAGMTTCSYPASVLERNRSSSVRIWAISNLHRISSWTATQCAIHPIFPRTLLLQSGIK